MRYDAVTSQPELVYSATFNTWFITRVMLPSAPRDTLAQNGLLRFGLSTQLLMMFLQPREAMTSLILMS